MAQRDPRTRAGRADVGREFGADPAILRQLRRPGRDRRRGRRYRRERVAERSGRTRSTKGFARYLDGPSIPEVDPSSGPPASSAFRTSSLAVRLCGTGVSRHALARFDRRHLWHACELYASRDRRYGGAQPNLVEPSPGARPVPARRAGSPIRTGEFNSRSPARAPKLGAAGPGAAETERPVPGSPRIRARRPPAGWRTSPWRCAVTASTPSSA